VGHGLVRRSGARSGWARWDEAGSGMPRIGMTRWGEVRPGRALAWSGEAVAGRGLVRRGSRVVSWQERVCLPTRAAGSIPARSTQAWLCAAGLGRPRHAVDGLGVARKGWARQCGPRSGRACLGESWQATQGSGLATHGEARNGMPWLGKSRSGWLRRGRSWQAEPCRGVAWRCKVWPGRSRCRMVWLGRALQAEARLVRAWLDAARRGRAWWGRARLALAGLGEALRG